MNPTWLSLPWVLRMKGVIQDSVYHAEGDVYVHTMLVLDALAQDPEYQALSQPDQETVWLACLAHDIAKPWTTAIEPDGRVSAKGHSSAGALEIRGILYRMGGIPPKQREEIAHLVRLHQVPFFWDASPEYERKILTNSFGCRNRLLSIVNRADGQGRVCPDQNRLFESAAFYQMGSEDLGCLDTPYVFKNNHARMKYFWGEGSRHDEPPEYYRCRVTLMSGLPGSGKSTWVANNSAGVEVISLDAIRREWKWKDGESQSPIAQEGHRRLKEALRKSRDVIWDATNLTREIRSKTLQIALDYGAETRIVCVETPYERVLRQNKNREHSVVESRLENMISRWEPPTRDECHLLERIFQT